MRLTILTENGAQDGANPYASNPVYRMLGYFSLVGLLRVHTLLGDFTLALKVMEDVGVCQKVGVNAVS